TNLRHTPRTAAPGGPGQVYWRARTLLPGRPAPTRARARARRGLLGWRPPDGALPPPGRPPERLSRDPRGRSSMVEPQSSKLATRVRFPSPAPTDPNDHPGAPPPRRGARRRPGHVAADRCPPVGRASADALQAGDVDR